MYRFISSRTVSVLLMGGLLGAAAVPAIAQSTFQLNLPNLQAPGNRESGSTRSITCIDPDEKLVALMPESNHGLTHQGYPTLYFYLPPTTATQVKFVMYNEATNELFYEGQFSLKGDSGIVSIELPDNGVQTPLALDQTYVWYLSVLCDVQDPSGDVVVEGQITRVEAPAGVTQADLQTLPERYAAAGLWIDALEAAALLKQQQNDGVAWNTLLRAVTLDELIAVPLIVDGVTVESDPRLSAVQLGNYLP